MRKLAHAITKIEDIPEHLRRYVVEQDYSRYTPVDQSVWRYILRQLRDYLSKHAHPCYLEGLEKTGIKIDEIPSIEFISSRLQEFGWFAVPVSGFIPPAAFMEFQSLSILPIASDMRTIDHIMYTPAPDIVHEAAGHAPILIEPGFSAYLKRYAQVASHAIISKQDLEQYEAIRLLSDLKEDPNSTPEQIRQAESGLGEITKSISHISEAAILARMNWWTAEYGLIGDINSPKIFGAGLLSSVGEARGCLKAHVRKIPLTIDCIDYSYDITEPQPQLFVTPDFQTLIKVLDELAATMAFNLGGTKGLEKALKAETVNTIMLDSGLEISGFLADYYTEIDDSRTGAPAAEQPYYLQLKGPTQLSYGNQELSGHGKDYHREGFGSPVGPLKGEPRPLSDFSEQDLENRGYKTGQLVELNFESGVTVRGRLLSQVRRDGKLILLSFQDCIVSREDKIFFKPEWGTFDMAVGQAVQSVYGGAADRIRYGATDQFVAKVIPRKQYTEKEVKRHEIYSSVRKLRESIQKNPSAKSLAEAQIADLMAAVEQFDNKEWLLFLELFEICHYVGIGGKMKDTLDAKLNDMAKMGSDFSVKILDGVRLAHVL